MSHYLALIVNALDTDENLPEGVRAQDVEFEMLQQFGTEVDFVATKVELFMCRENSEEGH